MFKIPRTSQPPSIQDPVSGDVDLEEYGVEVDDGTPETDDAPTDKSQKTPPNWLKRAKDAYRFSTAYTDSNYRQKWDNSIKAFNNEHPGDSKYNSDLFKKRSCLFRPKTRAIIRKNEAAAAAAFFSNMDLIDITASNQQEKAELLSADVTKQLLQYRLKKTIPWFQICIGGIQDAQVQACAVAHCYWRFLERHDEDGNSEALEDKPVIDLLPIENVRFDPSASWVDPVNTSPYFIHLIPMYWGEVKERMNYPNPKGQRWKKYGPSVVFAKSDNSDDTTRQARNQLSEDPTQQKRDISDYDIVWIHRHIHRWDAQDWEFYTIASERMLTDPEPLKNTVWHGKRPYVMGNVMIETHKPMPNSVPTLVKPLQDEANTLGNQRLDNVSFVLNKGWIVKRGKNVDLATLVRNVPGRIILADDPETDVKEQEWQDVTQSSYLEQDRIDGDFSDLVGNFNPMQVQAQRSGRESTNTMRMLQGPTNLLTEYMLKTYVETFVEPVLRQIVMLEQHYETDLTILTLAGQKAEAFKKYGVSRVTDAVLDKELNLTVNVGMGATDMVAKLQKFLYSLETFAKVTVRPPPGVDLKEVWKEIMALTGYQDGSRFLIDGQDPTVASLMRTIQQLQMAMQKGPQQKAQATHESNVVKLHTNRDNNLTKLALADKKHWSESKQMIAEWLMNSEQIDKEREGQVEDRDKERQGEVEDRNFGAQQESQLADKQLKAKKSGAQSK